MVEDIFIVSALLKIFITIKDYNSNYGIHHTKLWRVEALSPNAQAPEAGQWPS